MYRRYRSIHLECSRLGAPAMLANAIIASLDGGPVGTAERAVPVSQRLCADDKVDGGWYGKAIVGKPRITGIPKAIKAEPGGPAPIKPEPKEEPGVLPKTEPDLVPGPPIPTKEPTGVTPLATAAKPPPSRNAFQSRLDFLLAKDL